MGALAGNPFFAIKTRMQVYSTSENLKVGTQHAPTSLVAAFVSIGRQEGWRGFFRGIDAFMPRVVLYGAAQLSTYDAIKHRLNKWEAAPVTLRSHGIVQHAFCGFFAALASATAIQPFDFLAVRMQNQPVDPVTRKGLYYTGPLDTLSKVVAQEGPLALFKGYTANLLRFGPYTLLVFIFVEQVSTDSHMTIQTDNNTQIRDILRPKLEQR